MALFTAKEDNRTVFVCGVTAFLLLIFRLYKSYRDHKLRHSNGCEPPLTYPHRDGILGAGHIAKLIKAKRNHWLPTAFTQIFDDTGPEVNTVGLYMIGKKSYWTRDAENIRAIMSSQFSDWGLPPARKLTFATCLGGGIFGVDGPEWEHSRAVLRPSFNRSQIGNTEVLEKHAENLIARIPDGQIVDLADLFPLLTMDVGTEMLFGESIGSLDPSGKEKATEFTRSFDYIVRTMSKHMSLPILTKLPDAELKRCVAFIDEFATAVMDQTMSSNENQTAQYELSGSKKYIFPTELAKMGYPVDKIKIEVINIMVAGRDTTAALLSVVWWYLPRRPDIVKKLRRELQPLEGRPPTGEELKKLQYLKYVINEVLRLHPINPLNSRTAIRDTTLPRGGGPDGGSPIFVKKGQQFMFSSAALQRRKDLYGDDAMELKPERWEHIKPTAFEYIPFGGGPRICPGQQLALTEASFFTVRLLQAFENIEPDGEGPFQEAFAILVTSGDGVRVKFGRKVTIAGGNAVL